MQCYTPDHRTINDFRKNNREELESYFVEIVRIFNKLGFTQVGKIYIDGTKVKGNASSKRTKDRQGLEKWLSKIKEKIADLMKEAEAIDIEEEERYKSEEAQELLKKKLSNHKVYKGTECTNCVKRSLCTKAKVRELLLDICEPLLTNEREITQ